MDMAENPVDKSYPFDFTVIMAVYNVAPFLRQAVDSLIAQDLGFSRVQLILVDDGSTDGSAAICDEYAAAWPENIRVIHKENGGVSSARNAGLPLAQGRYVNFMDADDMLAPDVLRLVSAFFTAHEAETDMVSIPIWFFDARDGEHILNYKYKKGTRIVDLEEEWDHIQLSTSTAFIRLESIQKHRFDERLRYAEDAVIVQKILLDKMRLGVVADGKYMYRKRSNGEQSAIDKSYTSREWYLPPVEFSYRESFRYAKEKTGRIPRFIQFAVMYDLQWRLKKADIADGVMGEEEETQFREGIRDLLREIDTEVVMAQRQLPMAYKYYAIEKKFAGDLHVEASAEGLLLRSEGEDAFPLSQLKGRLEFLHLDGETLRIEGFLPLFSALEDAQLRLRIGENWFDAERKPVLEELRSLGEALPEAYEFQITVPLKEAPSKRTPLELFLSSAGELIRLEQWSFGPFMPFVRNNYYAYYAKAGWMLMPTKKGLSLQRISRKGLCKKKLVFLAGLWRKNKPGYREAVWMRLLAWLLRCFKRRPLWLVSDRGIKAGDNGEAFFRYLVSEHPEIDARFVINRDCADYARMKAIGPVLPKGTRRYQLRFLIADYVISSSADADVFNPFYKPGKEKQKAADPYRDLLADRRFIFLQHGVIKDDLSSWLMRKKKNLYGFIVSAQPEYESIVRGAYGYTEKEVWLTGLPRFDRLYRTDTKPRLITVMPTWRKWLVGAYDPETGTRQLAAGIRESEYIAFYNRLLNDKELLCAAEKNGYRLAILPHPNLVPFHEFIEIPDGVTLLGKDCEYRDIYAESDLVLTDYSSAIFDFVYLNRPVLYVQFDKERFFSGEHSYRKGYFDYERDGFGEVEYDLEGTVARLIEYMENGCQMKPEYRERADRFFAFNDRNNCRRVYEAIMARERGTGPRG